MSMTETPNETPTPSPAPKRGQVKIMKVRGDKKASKTIARMQAQGWTMTTSNVRKAAWSFWLGPFTRKQIHTLTFER